MKKKLLYFLLTSNILFAHTIQLTIENLKSDEGEVYIGLYNKANNFTIVDKAFQTQNMKSSTINLNTIFTNIPEGKYAIAIFHDENSNKQLDKNFLGIPNEGYGFSNNIRPTFRSATFKESTIIVNQDVNISITIGY